MALAKDYQPQLICDDTFTNGRSGWVPLVGSQYPTSVVGWDQEYAYADSKGSLILECANGAQDGVNNAFSTATAVKRLWRGSSVGVLEVEWIWCFGSQYDQESPRYVMFGVDTCHPTNSPRYYFQCRWLNYDSPSGTRVTKYQVLDSTLTTWVDVPGAVIAHGWNENKRDWHRTKLRVNLATGKYDGLQVDGDKFGSYAGGASMTAYGPKQEALPTFENGMNLVFGIANKSNTANNTHAWANLGRVRAKAIGWDL